jgi:hypothetical protein
LHSGIAEKFSKHAAFIFTDKVAEEKRVLLAKKNAEMWAEVEDIVAREKLKAGCSEQFSSPASKVLVL